MTQLDLDAKTMLLNLTESLDEVIVGQPETYPTAQQLHKEMRLSMEAMNPMLSLYEQGLANLSIWLKENQLPALSGLVINRSTRRPSDIFFNLFGKSRRDVAWWHNEIATAMRTDWQPYLHIATSMNPFFGQRIVILDEPDFS
jgi:hypothetical protein